MFLWAVFGRTFSNRLPIVDKRLIENLAEICYNYRVSARLLLLLPSKTGKCDSGGSIDKV
jgi:hypothetical protein